VFQEKLSTPEAGRRLEISEKTLANWVRLARSGKPMSSVRAPAEKRGNVSEMEISKLRAEVARLKM
jgi:transposase-like protein